MIKKLILANLLAVIAVCLAWLALDYVLVTSPNYPQNCNRGFWWFYLPIPVLLFGVNFWITKIMPKVKRIGLSIVITTVEWFILWLLMITIGFRLHYWIGGKL